MWYENLTFNSSQPSGEESIWMPDRFKFWLLLTFLIPSIICSLFVLYYLLSNRSSREIITNHAIIIIVIIVLICELTTYPCVLYYYQLSHRWEKSFLFCEISAFIDWGSYFTHKIIFSWGTIERHILIFHDECLATRKKRLIVHYLPLGLLLLYCSIFYIIVIFFPFCKNYTTDFNAYLHFCFYHNVILHWWQIIFHQMVPNFIIIAFSLGLLIRVFLQKYRLHQKMQLRKYRNMIIQMLSISCLYLASSFPLKIAHLIMIIDPSYDLDDFVNYFSYYIMILLPFIFLFSLPELRQRINNILHLNRRSRQIIPEFRGIRTNTRHTMLFSK